ncbi:2-keto-4-pentenoate hydratase/2-oxohepta-3-ene-1,7-dioic acid hydratase in catechol pathway [Arthrobacter pascens]|uniref:fumarylacetoacetate hydrolase family protein n=1 Tax=Arthrobacter pascens TaxID=1677 RepID=UPI002861EF6B|nr:fumarylacetoacetate hydrolase family protein [Arthrobacter pascens]MDR6559835.1 2-keto-4-pentenoate hydratase/2-oxohepta-3-ene-1,7-dioic acid hydratase in catechol pathway [Arthrobacter pascens]
MRIANLSNRLALITDGRAVDVHEASGGRFGPSPQSAYDDWEAFVDWTRGADLSSSSSTDLDALGSPAPTPRQVFAIGLNYVNHAKESGLPVPSVPMVFTKFPSSITGPTGTINLSGDSVDWEVELVAVIGIEARNVSEADAWKYVAGLTVGQDLSDRRVQLEGKSPQFSLGKSFEKYAPMGPWLVTVDEFENPDDLRVSCLKGEESVQDSRTSDLVFSVPQLVSYLSKIVTLFPGDVIFTGTPEGVGLGRSPQIYLQDGDVLTTTIEGIGSMTHQFTRPAEPNNAARNIGSRFEEPTTNVVPATS